MGVMDDYLRLSRDNTPILDLPLSLRSDVIPDHYVQLIKIISEASEDELDRFVTAFKDEALKLGVKL